jgi:hypothetical protein
LLRLAVIPILPLEVWNGAWRLEKKWKGIGGLKRADEGAIGRGIVRERYKSLQKVI